MKRFRCDLYYPVLDIMIEELKRRFTGEALDVATASEEFLRLNENGAESFINKYLVPGLNKTVLLAEMGILKCVIKAENYDPNDITLKDLVKVLKDLVFDQGDIYPHFKKLFQISLTLPSNSATCERSFSAMRRINNWLRCKWDKSGFLTLQCYFRSQIL